MGFVNGIELPSQRWEISVPRIRANEAKLRQTREWPIFQRMADDLTGRGSVGSPDAERPRGRRLCQWLHRLRMALGGKDNE